MKKNVDINATHTQLVYTLQILSTNKEKIEVRISAMIKFIRFRFVRRSPVLLLAFTFSPNSSYHFSGTFDFLLPPFYDFSIFLLHCSSFTILN